MGNPSERKTFQIVSLSELLSVLRYFPQRLSSRMRYGPGIKREKKSYSRAPLPQVPASLASSLSP